MESENSITLESCEGDSILIESVKSIVGENTCTELESEEEGFFVVTDVQDEQQNVMEVSNEESTVTQSEEQFSWSNLCRVCANTNDHLISIFEGEGLQHDLCSKIHKYLPIHISENDTLPLQLCYHCAATLLAWHELLEGCLNAERRLLEMQDALQERQNSEELEISAQDATSVPNITEPLQQQEQQQQQQQENVKEEAASVESAVNDSERFGQPRKKSCSRQTLQSKAIAKDSVSDTDDNSFHTGFNMLRIMKTTLPSFDQNQCPKSIQPNSNGTKNATSSTGTNTPNTKESEESFHRYPKRKRLQTHPCMYCDYTCKQKKLLEVHLAESHPEFNRKKNKKPRCVDKELVTRAKMEVDGKIYYHCNECGKNLYSPYTFFWHVRIHTGERPYTCHLCGKQFRVNQGLARHLKDTHAGIKNFPCDICGRMFSTKRSAEDHRRIHTGERPYICNVCGKSFKQKASLFVHNRTHSEVFPFKCNYCDQNFRTRPPLVLHMTKHTGEKPHACDICGRPFRIKHELKRHRLIHFDEKPWRCAECDLSFRQKRYLINHRKLNHNANPSLANSVR